METFYRGVLESIVDNSIIICGETEDSEKDSTMITIIYKTGKCDTMDGKDFELTRKNSKIKRRMST